MDMHKALRTPDPERLLPKRRTKRLDPVTENQILLTGGSVEAFPEQDHMSHIQAHDLFVQEAQGMGLDPQILNAASINMSAHIAEHHAHAYRLRIQQELQRPLPDTNFKDVRDAEDLDIEIDNDIARSVAENIAPPPPPQGPEPSEPEMKQQLHEQTLQHNDETHKQSLSHKDETHDQAVENKDEAAEQDLKKKAGMNVLDAAGKAAALKVE
jgi:hypothetical protein